VRTIRGDWLSLEPENRNQWAVPGREGSPLRRQGKSSFVPRG
jgi:hypothetical protein